MSRKEEIQEKAVEFVNNRYCDMNMKTTLEASVAACQDMAEWVDSNPDGNMLLHVLGKGVKQGQKDALEKLCRCYCDDICEKGMAGMCFHKHDGQGQVKNLFMYDECNDLKLLRNSIKD